jgi:aminobenzoyl-glutamate utilization protein B
MRVGKQLNAMLAQRPIPDFIVPFPENAAMSPASTDVADVSWSVPTGQVMTAAWAYATPAHTWQVVAQGKSSYAHKAMLYAGKIMACSAIQALQDPELLKSAKDELERCKNGEEYDCLIPTDVKAPRLSSLS